MNISIFGLGYVGAVSMACLARDGHKIYGVDIDPIKLALIRKGNSPIIEEGMPELMKEVVSNGSLEVTDNINLAIDNTDVSFICVGTPSQLNGSQDQSAVLRLAEQLGAALSAKNSLHTIVFRSTLVPGTVEETLIPLLEKHSGKKANVDFDVCFQPEFLRESTSIKDYDNPPFTIVGAATERAHQTMNTLFGHLPTEYHRADIRTGETVKYFCNIFHALKITFANEVGRLCDAMKIDAHQVMALLCEDRQLNISPAYLKPGFAFGGSCLPKDLRAMQYVAKMNDIEIPMLANVLKSNEEHLHLAVKRVLATGKRKVGMIGLSFKSGTDDLRESPLVDLAELLIGKGMDLSIYDPEVNLSFLIGANKRYIEESIPHVGELMNDDVHAVIENNEVIVVGIGDKNLLEALVDNAKPGQIVIDLVNMKNKDQLNCIYQGLCW